MAKKEKDEEKVETTTDESTTETSETSKPAKSITFKVRDNNVKGGIKARVFSAEVHGKDFKAVADMFAETNKKRIISRE